MHTLSTFTVKKTFPNNWQEVHDTPAEAFAELEYDTMMDMLMMWHIPSSHCCIMRVENKATGKIKEYSYQKLHAAKSRLVQLAQDKDNEILVADEDTIAVFKKHIHPVNLPPFEDDDLA